MRSLAPAAALPLLSLLAAAAACSSSISKRPARPHQPTTTTTSTSTTTSSTTTPPPPPRRDNVTFPTYRCPHPYSEYYCLNDAKCFTILIQDAPLYNCECRDGYVGQRCEYKDLDGSYLLSRGGFTLEKASIATGALCAVLIFVCVCAGAWLRVRNANKQVPGEEEERGRGRWCSSSRSATITRQPP